MRSKDERPLSPAAVIQSLNLNGCTQPVAAGDVGPLSSRSGPHSGHSCASDISDPVAYFKVLLTSANSA